MNQLLIKAGRTGDWVQVQGSCFASAGPPVHRQCTISPGAGQRQGKHLSTSQARQGGAK